MTCPGCDTGRLELVPCVVSGTYVDRGYVVTATNRTQVLMCNRCEVAVDMRDTRGRIKPVALIFVELLEVANC